MADKSPPIPSEVFEKMLSRAAKTLLSLDLTEHQLNGVLNVLQEAMEEAGYEVIRLARKTLLTQQQGAFRIPLDGDPDASS